MNRITDRFLPKIDSDWFRNRLFVLMICALAVFALLAGRLFYLQILNGDHYRELSKNNCLRKVRIEPLRGLIYDREGRLLVDNRPSFDLRIIPNDADPLEKTAQRLSDFIDMTPQEIKAKVLKNRGPYGYASVLLKRDIGRDTMGILLSHRYELPGITINTNARRNYIYDGLAAHMIGYLGEISPEELKGKKYPQKRGGDMVGRSGLEKTFEAPLSGKPVKKIVQVNATGQVVHVLGKEPAQPGHNLFLTLDLELQHTAETLLEGKTGAIVAVNPQTGDILAMASSPNFSQNAFINGLSAKQWRKLITDPERPMRNKAIQAEYPPASTYKIITAMAALGEDIVNQNATYYCPGQFQFGNRIYRCWKRQGHGSVNLVEAIAQSCDVFYYHLGKQLGVDKMAWYARACGLGSQTGIGLLHEADGLIPTAGWKQRVKNEPWQAGENLSVAIGQGANLVTPLQMAIVIAAIANSGTIYKPHIMKSIKSVGGRRVNDFPPEPSAKLPVSKESLEIIQKGLYDAVNRQKGTAYWYVRSKEVSISGKTGTAQVVSRRSSSEEEYEERIKENAPHAWFIGYAPSERPEIAVSVLIEHGEHGSSGAGPIFKSLILNYLGHADDVEKSKPENDQE